MATGGYVDTRTTNYHTVSDENREADDGKHLQAGRQIDPQQPPGKKKSSAAAVGFFLPLAWDDLHKQARGGVVDKCIVHSIRARWIASRRTSQCSVPRRRRAGRVVVVVDGHRGLPVPHGQRTRRLHGRCSFALMNLGRCSFALMNQCRGGKPVVVVVVVVVVVIVSVRACVVGCYLLLRRRPWGLTICGPLCAHCQQLTLQVKRRHRACQQGPAPVRRRTARASSSSKSKHCQSVAQSDKNAASRRFVCHSRLALVASAAPLQTPGE